ncbi:MAG TPA: hypothetical protein PLD25_30495 [Chloroflexota bacterium]|nr:hypothetical protein [Chloroflexota bacterium]
MRPFVLFLFLLALGLGSCAILTRSLQPTIDMAAQTWVAAETRTDPIDDLVRFREAERRGRSASLLLPFLLLSTLALLVLLLLTPLPHLLKELRLLRRRQSHARSATPSQNWIDRPPERPYPTMPSTPMTPAPPALPPPQASEWLESD